MCQLPMPGGVVRVGEMISCVTEVGLGFVVGLSIVFWSEGIGLVTGVCCGRMTIGALGSVSQRKVGIGGAEDVL